jgi:CRISPR-associated protein Cmr4
VVDLPVAREAATDYPVMVGSSLKGALRDKATAGQVIEEAAANHAFGMPDQAGELLISDGRLLLLPVRSLTGAARWVTCPHLVERYRRDLLRAGLSPLPVKPSLDQGQALASGSGYLFLEERQFMIVAAPATDLVEAIETLMIHAEVRQRLSEQVVVVHDDDFAWFARYGLSVQARNALSKDGTKRSESLWYEETLPPDSLMYAIVLGRTEDSLEPLHRLFPKSDPYLQAGGNETVGHGWFAVSIRNGQTGGGA